MIEFKMPKLGESVTEGTIGRWLKQPGDTLEQYEPMLEVTTDKVDTEVSAPVSGTLLEILVPEGETVAVGTVIARLQEGDASGATNGQVAVAEPARTEPVAAKANSTAGAASGSQPPTPSPQPQAFVSPVVARLAAEHGINLADVPGTGGGGRVTKKDIEKFLSSQRSGASGQQGAASDQESTPVEVAELQQTLEVGPLADEEPEKATISRSSAPDLRSVASQPPATSPQPLVPGPDDELVPLSPMRRAIAEHMVRSKRTAPHVTTVMEADLSRIVAHRAKNKADFERQGVKLTFTAYFVQAVVAGLQQVPIVNASFGDDGIVMHNRINIGMAAAIPDGLIVPVIKDADEKSLLGLARAVNDLADRARSRRLQADDTRDGTFTITNHGVSGSIFAMPIINQPQSAILGVGAMQKRVVVISDNGLDSMAIRPMCYLSLTFDHRLIDGATADQFLGIVKRTLETYGG